MYNLDSTRPSHMIRFACWPAPFQETRPIRHCALCYCIIVCFDVDASMLSSSTREFTIMSLQRQGASHHQVHHATTSRARSSKAIRQSLPSGRHPCVCCVQRRRFHSISDIHLTRTSRLQPSLFTCLLARAVPLLILPATSIRSMTLLLRWFL